MSRSARRKPSLSESSSVSPPSQEKHPVHQSATATGVPGGEEPTTVRKKKCRHNVSFYQDPADTDRVCGAILHTMVTEGNGNLSQFANNAVMAKVVELEAKYNNGHPFPTFRARELPQGGAAATSE